MAARRLALIVAPAMLALAGCEAGLDGAGPASQRVDVVPAVADGRVILDGPSGYCLLSNETTAQAGTAYVLYHPCDGAGSETGAPLLTAMVDLDQSADLEISTEALLAGMGVSEALERVETDGLVLLQVDDTVTPKWRGAMDVHGHLLLLGAHGDAASAGDLRDFARAIRRASGGAGFLSAILP
ncbi:hypothetical protein [Poseidonocella sedimentorum]|uniref:Uncharacterized protein n=1 Tax=Poseidonocella sedimentorum TaxID=871652 RepID=A0A1I6D647_9RHOB|nr:hypothetical protein [Poseidonocella sedimentorum]SFR00873.1 hypothetical protein SAMN04515673_102239 [Poseidonocella sedimentorum]